MFCEIIILDIHCKTENVMYIFFDHFIDFIIYDINLIDINLKI